MIVVHHLNNSRSQRVLWMLEELGVPYEIIAYARDASFRAPPELRVVHPLGKSPVLVDGAKVIAESAVILEYLCERYGSGEFKPAAGSPADERYRYWMHYAEGSAMTPLLFKLVFSTMPKQRMPFFIRPVVRAIAARALRTFVDPQLALHINFMESELKPNAWFAGDTFTAADIQMSFPIEAAAARGGLSDAHPHLADFLRRIRARPAYQRAEARGGSFSIVS